jgi:hypothetical protein
MGLGRGEPDHQFRQCGSGGEATHVAGKFRALPIHVEAGQCVQVTLTLEVEPQGTFIEHLEHGSHAALWPHGTLGHHALDPVLERQEAGNA